jgi:hypothetical protein
MSMLTTLEEAIRSADGGAEVVVAQRPGPGPPLDLKAGPKGKPRSSVRWRWFRR